MPPDGADTADAAEGEREPSTEVGCVDERKHTPKSRPGRLTPVACVGCQRRKSKCDGHRPSCSACHSRTAVCFYDVADGLSRTADLRQKNTALSERVVELEQLVSRLRSQDDARAASTLARLRIGDDIRAILTHDADTDTDPSIGPDKKRPRFFHQEVVDSQNLCQQAFGTPSMAPNIPYHAAVQYQRRELWPGRTQPIDPLDSQRSWLAPLWDRDRDILSSRADHSRDQGDSVPDQDMAAAAEFHRKINDYKSSKSAQEISDGWRKRSNIVCVSASVLHFTDLFLVHHNRDGHNTANGSRGQHHHRQLDDISVPVWAVLPRHEYDESPVDTSYSEFLHHKRQQLERGLPLSSICGSRPAIEALFSDDAFTHADELSRWAARVAFSCKSTPSMEQVVLFWSGWHLMRWLLLPCAANLASVPDWLRPTPCQLLVPHNICNDFIPWPLLRETICQRPAMQLTLDWFVELQRTMSCNWPHDLNAGLYRDGDTGFLFLNPMLVDHVGNMQNWTVGPRFRAFLSNVDAFVRVKYGEEK